MRKLKAEILLLACCLLWGGVALGAGFGPSSYMQVDIGTTDAVTIMEWAKTNGTWQHYAEVGSTQYINGVAGSFGNVMWTYAGSTITNGNFTGDAEDLSAWDRALSASDVAAKFNEQAEYRGFTYTNSAGMRALGTPPQAMEDVDPVALYDVSTNERHAVTADAEVFVDTDSSGNPIFNTVGQGGNDCPQTNWVINNVGYSWGGWIYLEDTVSGYNPIFGQLRAGTPSAGLGLCFRNESAVDRLYGVCSRYGSVPPDYYNNLYYDITTHYDEWMHVVVTASEMDDDDGDAVTKLYINGSKVAQYTNDTNQANSGPYDADFYVNGGDNGSHATVSVLGTVKLRDVFFAETEMTETQVTNSMSGAMPDNIVVHYHGRLPKEQSLVFSDSLSVYGYATGGTITNGTTKSSVVGGHEMTYEGGVTNE